MNEPSHGSPFSAQVDRARAYFRSEVTLPLAFRLDRLRALKGGLAAFEGRFLDALRADLGKCAVEAYQTELGFVNAELNAALAQLKRWTKPRRAGVPFVLRPASAAQVQEPLGTALIISPWNYPCQLALAPLVGAIGAGCNAVLKPSELSPATSGVLEACLKSTFGEDGFVTVVQGGADECTHLLRERWDVVFFTGSMRVGRVVMEAAAKHLTPVVLELGGKTPCVVDVDVDVDVAARRIVWGKFTNAGQTCIAPDYLLVHRAVKGRLLDALQAAVKASFGEDVSRSPDFGRIVTARHHRRLVSLLEGGRIVFGGAHDEATRYMAPTVLTEVDLAHPLMQEEIFGPLLPVVEVADVDEAIRFCRDRPKPLALYVFTNDSRRSDEVLRRVSAGGAVVNDTLIHIACGELPFGGVGASGLGKYHGRAGLDAFSHWKAVVWKPFFMDLKLRYPPYKVSIDLLRRVQG